MTGASKFPRHWLYNDTGELTHKSGLTDYSNWMAVSFGQHTPWGDEDSEALVTAGKEIGFNVPVVVRLEGTNVDRARQILGEAKKDMPQLISATDLTDAAKKVVAAVA